MGVDRWHGRPGRAWWIAPTYKIARVGWRSILKMSRQIPGVEIRLSDMEITYPTGGVVAVRSADSPAGLRAEGLDLAVLDEAAYIAEDRWKEDLRPALSDRLGSALFISTPRGFNWFHGLWDGASGSWAAFQYPTSANPLISELELHEARQELGSHVFAQEYEAQFVEVGGGIFKDQWFNYFTMFTVEEEDGEEVTHYRYADTHIAATDCWRMVFVDPAVSTKTSADYTAMAVVAFTPDKHLLVLEMLRERMEGPDVIPTATRLMSKWEAKMMGIESVAAQLTFFQEAQRRGVPVKKLKADRDKLARALPLQARFEAGQVHFLANAPWIPDLESELKVFRGDGEGHDDQVDALAYAAVEAGARRRLTAH